MKTYRRHYCERAHRSYSTAGRCIWGRRAAWVDGDGPYALLAHCSVLTVTVWTSLERATDARAEIDSTGCGHACRRDHEFVRLDERVLERPA